MDSITLALTAGDHNGIGPEIVLKSLAEQEIRSLCSFIVVGSEEVFQMTYERFSPAQQNKYKYGLAAVMENLHSPSKMVKIDSEGFTPGQSTAVSGKAACASLQEALNFCNNRRCQGVVTGPIMKKTFFPPEVPFNGQTEWIAHSVGSSQSLMIMAFRTFRVGLVTTHIPLRSVAESLSVDLIVEKGKLFYNSLASDFGVTNPQIAICSLNPHAGESGKFGDEEQTLLQPALEELGKLPAEWSGPFPSDTLFIEANMKKFDGILALYHDQGLIPFKMYCGFAGVNMTAGLPIVRTSPDHGVALDIAGCGTADHDGYSEAIKLAAGIVLRRAAED
jgi:4-hydroxythreonine-4-phosphate dehydrogenase